MSDIRYGAYYPTDRLIDWLNSDALYPMEQSAFGHWLGIRNLTALVDRYLVGEVPQFVAADAIDQYNKSNGTSLTFDEIAGKYSHNFIFSQEAEWVIYTDLPGLGHLIKGEHEDPVDAMEEAPPDCQWMIIWLTHTKDILVYRSPHLGWRGVVDPEGEDDGRHAQGLAHGPLLTYTLPPEVEGSIRGELRDYHLASQPSPAK